MCCGKKRDELRGTPHKGGLDPMEPRKVAPSPAVYFKYFGATGLTAIGPVSGRTYRFSAPGATHAVDPRDAPSLAGVPNLRRLATGPRSSP